MHISTGDRLSILFRDLLDALLRKEARRVRGGVACALKECGEQQVVDLGKARAAADEALVLIETEETKDKNWGGRRVLTINAAVAQQSILIKTHIFKRDTRVELKYEIRRLVFIRKPSSLLDEALLVQNCLLLTLGSCFRF